jgi:hypothetical protein
VGQLSPGRLEIDFTSPNHLAEQVALVALALEDEWDTFRLAEVVPKSKFEDRYVPRQAESDHSAEDGAAVQKMFKELEVAERELPEKC